MNRPLPSTALSLPPGSPQGLAPHGDGHALGGDDELAGVYHAGGYGAVTQATSITTAVTLNRRRGTVTTVSQTLAAAGEASFTVNNTEVRAEDVVVACLKSTSSAGGPFLVAVTAVADGSFVITVSNLHATAAGDNTLSINFAVLTVEAGRFV